LRGRVGVGIGDCRDMAGGLDLGGAVGRGCWSEGLRRALDAPTCNRLVAVRGGIGRLAAL
jgi:hypothetical protein